MNTPTIPQAPPQAKPFPQLHVPTFSTMTCLHCGAPITGLEAWLATRECPGAAAEGVPVMSRLTPEQLEAVNDSDALCEGCGANPRETETLDGWFVDQVVTDDRAVAVIRCPRCW